jgi:hypothetical protein
LREIRRPFPTTSREEGKEKASDSEEFFVARSSELLIFNSPCTRARFTDVKVFHRKQVRKNYARGHVATARRKAMRNQQKVSRSSRFGIKIFRRLGLRESSPQGQAGNRGGI